MRLFQRISWGPRCSVGRVALGLSQAVAGEFLAPSFTRDLNWPSPGD
jgi:hypothetical protein